MTFNEEYTKWNSLLLEYFFNGEHQGEHVLIFVNKEVIDEIGKDLGGETGFLKTVQVINDSTRGGICSYTLNKFKNWRKRYVCPTYIASLAFFVYCSTLEDTVGRDSYYRKLRGALGEESPEAKPIYAFNEMRKVWYDLDKWSNDDTDGQYGLFTFYGDTQFVHVGLPRSQALISGTQLLSLPYLFHRAGFSADPQPSEEEMVTALLKWGLDGKGHMSSHTRRLIESNRPGKKAPPGDIKEAYQRLLKMIFDSLANWDGSVPEGAPEQAQKEIFGWFCIKKGLISNSISLRINNQQLMGSGNAYFSGKDIRGVETLRCEPSFQGNYYSKRLQTKFGEEWKDLQITQHPEIWAGIKISRKGHGPDIEVPKTSVRVFLPGAWWTDSEDWIEAKRLERGCKFLVACEERHIKLIKHWGEKSCNSFCKYSFSGLPEGWNFFEGDGANEPLTNCNKLSFPPVSTVRLIGGLKVKLFGKRSRYLSLSPPIIRIDGASPDDLVIARYKMAEEECVVKLTKNSESRPEWEVPEELLGLNEGLTISIETGQFSEVGKWEKSGYARRIELLPVKMNREIKKRVKRGSNGKILEGEGGSSMAWVEGAAISQNAGPDK